MVPGSRIIFLTLIYNLLSGGNTLQESERLRHDDALKRVLGSERIPHATTLGKFLWRFGDRKRSGTDWR